MTAAQLYKEGKYQEALVAYNALVQTSPVAANYLGLAQCYQKLGYTIHAIEALNEGIAHNPQDIDLQFLLAQIHFSAHNLDAAKEILEPLYASNKENLAVVAMYLNHCIAMRDYHKAATLIPFLSKKGGNHAGILNNIGLVYVEKKGHGYTLQLLSVHDDPLLLKVKKYLEKNLKEEWYPHIPYRKNRTNNRMLFGIRD